MSIYVVVPSNSSMEYFPDNTLANFRVKLGKPLVLDGRYEVALTEIIYPHRRLTVQPSEATIQVSTLKRVGQGKRKAEEDSMTEPDADTAPIERKKKSVEYSGQPTTKNSTVKYILSAGTYDSARELYHQLLLLLRTAAVQIHLNPASGMFKMSLKRSVTQVVLSPRMAHMIGFTPAEVSYTVSTPSVVKAQYMPHLDSTAHSLYIYTSIVDHQLVGNAVAPLLRVVCPDSDKLGQTVSEKYIKPNYLPVSSSYIDTIDVQIRTTTGHLFPFTSGTPVVLTLHFVRHGSG